MYQQKFSLYSIFHILIHLYNNSLYNNLSLKKPYNQTYKTIMETLLDIGMAVGPVLGYIHQYYIISSSKSVGTFCIDICGILLFANILRLNFYVFTKYATALLWQSVIMIVAQIFLVHVCTKYKCKKNVELIGEVPGSGNMERLENFWRWNQFSTYFLFIAAFTFLSFAITLTFKQYDIQYYGVFVGLTALLSQSVLILPQIIKNFKKKSTKGLSYLLVSLNLLGDIFKFVYFIIKSQAFQFIICGAVQIVLDSFVIFQIYFYRGDRYAVDKDDNQTIEERDKYEIEDEIKPETQKNLGQMEMEMVDPRGNGRLQCEEDLYISDPKTHFRDGQYVYNNCQLKLPPKLSVEEEKSLAFQQTQKLSQLQSKQVEVHSSIFEHSSDKDLSSTQQETNSQTNNSRKALSSQNIPSLSSTEFFQASYVVPPKSMENVKVEA